MTLFHEMALSPGIQKSVKELGFELPTPIQQKTIPVILNEQTDIIARAQTGTGKTAAFGLPLLQQLDPHITDVQALILSPTRELAMQIAKDLTAFSKYIPEVKTGVVYGGADIQKQIRQLDRGVSVVVGTPGRTLDLIKRKKLKVNKIRWLVLDEADEMLSMGFRDELDAILATSPPERQTLLFSATMPREILAIANKYMSDPCEITVGKKNSGAENVEHHYYLIHARDRYNALKRIVDLNPGIYGIIFCRTRAEARDVAEKLMHEGYRADALHGELSQAQRDQIMDRFRKKNLQVLVATDVAARGLDVNDLTHVIHYNLPDDPEVYIHRSGRTGRAGKRGISVTLIHLREQGKLRQVEKKVNKKFIKKPVPLGKEICAKQLFNLIDGVEKAEVNEARIEAFMPVIYKKLAWMEREDLIKHFVSAEFNRLLSAYENVSDINVDETHFSPGDSEPKTNGKRGKKRVSGRGHPKKGDYEFSRFFFSLGKKNGINKRTIIDLVNEHLPGKNAEIGDIEVMKSFSFFEVDKRYERDILKTFKKSRYKGQRMGIDIAKRD